MFSGYWGAGGAREGNNLLEGNLCQRDDGDEYDDEDGKGLGIAIRFEDVGGYFVADFFAKHKEASYGHA